MLENSIKNLLILLFREKKIQEKVGKYTKDPQREKGEKKLNTLTMSLEHCPHYHIYFKNQLKLPNNTLTTHLFQYLPRTYFIGTAVEQPKTAPYRLAMKTPLYKIK